MYRARGIEQSGQNSEIADVGEQRGKTDASEAELDPLH